MTSRAAEWARKMQEKKNANAEAVRKMGENRVAANFSSINPNNMHKRQANLELRTLTNNQARLNAYTQKVRLSENRARNLASGNSLNFTARLRSPLNRLSNASPKKSWWGSKTRRSKKRRSTRKQK